MASQGKGNSIKLSTYDELFKGSEAAAKTLRKFRSLKRKATVNRNNELIGVLQKQRILVDENAIHFVAEARAGPRADARNSVFKLAQRYQVLPDREHVKKMKQLYGGVKENEDSGDEDWDKAYSKLPGKSSQAFLTLVQKADNQEHLLNEIDVIENETQTLTQGIVTQEVLPSDEPIERFQRVIEEQNTQFWPSRAEEDSSDADSDVSFDQDDMKTLNSMQREFMGNNLLAWFKDIQIAYETGVKLVKVNRLGHKFIRIVKIQNMILSISQPHTKSQAKLDRQVAVHEIRALHLGTGSKEFEALDKLIETGAEPKEFSASPTCCCVVDLPKARRLSLLFLSEENRNGFVFFTRVLIKKARAVEAQLCGK